MNTSIRRVAMVAALVILVTGGFALAQQSSTQPPQDRQGQMMRGGMGPGGLGPMMLGRLNLTDQQRSQIQALQQQHRTEHQQLMQKMADLQRELRDAIFADNGPDEARASQAQQQIAQLEPQMQQARVQMEVAVAKILTPEQRKQAREMQPGPGGRRMGRGMGHNQVK